MHLKTIEIHMQISLKFFNSPQNLVRRCKAVVVAEKNEHSSTFKIYVGVTSLKVTNEIYKKIHKVDFEINFTIM